MEFFMRIPCLSRVCGYHGGSEARIRVEATNITEALKELEAFAKSQPPSENFACRPGKPRLFQLAEILIY